MGGLEQLKGDRRRLLFKKNKIQLFVSILLVKTICGLNV